MLKLERFTIDDFASNIKEQTSSWTSKLPFVRSSEGVKEGRRVVKLIDMFTDEQKKRPTSLTEGERYVGGPTIYCNHLVLFLTLYAFY